MLFKTNNEYISGLETGLETKMFHIIGTSFPFQFQ